MSIIVNPNVSPRIITVPISDGTEITIQNLMNQVRDWEDEPPNLSYPHLLSATGKDDLGGGAKVGITIRLINTKLKFGERTVWTTCSVSGGNLTAVDGNGVSMYPIEPSDYVTVQLVQSTSASLIQDDDIDAIKAKTDNLPTNPADETTLTSIKGTGWTTETLKIIKDAIGATDKGRISVK